MVGFHSLKPRFFAAWYAGGIRNPKWSLSQTRKRQRPDNTRIRCFIYILNMQLLPLFDPNGRTVRSILEKLNERNRPSVQVHMLCNFSGYTGMTHYISIFNQIPCNRLTGHSTPGATCPIRAAGALGKPQNTRPEAGTPQRKVRTICIENTEKSVIFFWNFPWQVT